MEMAEEEINRLREREREQEARLAQLSELITRTRHELNNPLTGIIGQAQLLLRAELDPKTRRRVETIEELSTRLRDMIMHLRLPTDSASSSGSDASSKPQDRNND